MTYRITNPDYVTLTVQIAVRTVVPLTVEIQVPRADADDLDFDAEDLLADDTLALKITHTGAANTNDTFNSDAENLAALDAAAAEALAEYRTTLGGSMTLTDALTKALDPAAHASNLTPLRQIVAHIVIDPADAPRGLVSRVLLFGLTPLGEGGHFAAEIPEIVMCCVNAGADLDDFRTVINEPAVAPEIPRSAEWVKAAERLAAWADGEVVK